MLEGAEMSRRGRQHGTFAVVLALLVWAIAGCAGGSTATTTLPTDGGLATTTSETPAASATTSSTLATSELVDGVPAEYVEAFGQRPIVILFYVPGGVTDEKVLKVVNELSVTFREYTFLTYDYRAPTVYGDLAQALKITNQPQLVLIDRHANRYKVWSGYVDKGTLYQSLVNLGRL
jgi:hypothetical protein